MFVQYKDKSQLSFIHFVQSLLMLGRGGLVKEAIISKSGKMTENASSAKVETTLSTNVPSSQLEWCIWLFNSQTKLSMTSRLGETDIIKALSAHHRCERTHGTGETD